MLELTDVGFKGSVHADCVVLIVEISAEISGFSFRNYVVIHHLLHKESETFLLFGWK